MSKKNKALMIDVHKTLLNDDGTINDGLYRLVECLGKAYTICLVTGRYYDSAGKFYNDIKELTSLSDSLAYNEHDVPNEQFKLEQAVNLLDEYKHVVIIDNNKKVIKKLHKAGFDTLKYKEQK